MELSSLILYFHFSTATYSVEIFTPDINIKNVYSLKVILIGMLGEKTEEHFLVHSRTAPETETKGYVIYQTLETVFYDITNTEKRFENMAHREVYLTNLRPRLFVDNAIHRISHSLWIGWFVL